MSYTYEFGEAALAQFRALDPWLAEETLDELESLLQNPPLTRRRIAGMVVHDFSRIRGTDIAYVFLTIVVNRERSVLYIRSVGSYSRSSL